MSAEYSIELAKSNRSTCKVCKIKIDMGCVRIGTAVPGPGDYMMTSWRHVACQKKPPALKSLAQLAGFEALERQEAADFFESLTARGQAQVLLGVPAPERVLWARLLGPDDAVVANVETVDGADAGGHGATSGCCATP